MMRAIHTHDTTFFVLLMQTHIHYTMSNTCTLYRGETRLDSQLDDLNVERICRFFQVSSTTLYITDDENVAIFPEDNGSFLDVAPRQHYEVHGVAEDTGPALRARSNQSQVKPFLKNIFLAERVSGTWTPQKSLPIRFNEQDASVPGLLSIVNHALGTEDRYILADNRGHEILDCDATKGSDYWRVTGRKVLVVPKQEFLESIAKKRSRPENHMHLPDNVETEASANWRQAVSFTQHEKAGLKDAFECLICKGPMDEPCFATCCRSLIACRVCLDRWLQNSGHCIKCRADNCRNNIFIVAGLGGALSALDDVIND